MPATQQTSSSNGHDKAYDFTPVDFDIGSMPPRCGAGRYEASCAVSSKPTNADKLPMLMVEWTLTAVADGNEANETSIGQKVTDFIVLRPEGDIKGRMPKQQLRMLLDRLGLSYDIVPRRIETKADLEELAAAISGQSMVITVSVSEDQNTGESRERISYREPREASDAGSEETEVEEPVRPAAHTAAARPAARSAPKAAAKTATRRR